GAVGKHHVGRHVLDAGEFEPQRLERTEKARLLAVERGVRLLAEDGRGLLAGRALAGFARALRTQLDALGALEHAPAEIGHAPAAIFGDLQIDRAERIE